MKVLVLGSGLMGRGAAFDLARNDAVKEIIVADRDPKRAEALAEEMGPKVVAETVDAADRKSVV